MRKLYTIIIGIFLTFLFISCTQFTADIEDVFLSYWSTEVASTNFTIDTPYTRVGEMPYVSSAEDVTVTIKLRNPKKLTLKMPTSSDNVIRFPGLSTQPQYGTAKDYTLTQTTSNKLTLTYKKDFLQAHEWGSGDIGAEITFIADDNRVFDKRFSMNFKVNTPPALEYKGVGKTQADGKWYYVLIFQAQNMNDTLPSPLLHLHGDIKKLHITKESGESSVYTMQNINFSSQTFSWSPGDPLLDTATQLGSGDYEGAAPDFPSSTDKWLIYYKTDIEVSASSAAKTYTAQLSDAAGLLSNEVECSTVKRKVGEIKLEVTNPSPYTSPSSETGEDDHPYSIRCDEDGATLKATCNTPGVTISYTVYDITSGTEAKKSEGSGASPLTGIRLPAPTNPRDIKKYKVVLKAASPGFTENTCEVYYRLIRATTIDSSMPNAWKMLKRVVASATEGDIITIKGEIKATNDSGNYDEIIINKDLTIRGKSSKDTDILNANGNTGSKPVHRIFNVQTGKTLTLSGLTLKNATAPSGGDGGAILVNISNGKVVLSNCTIKDCKADTNRNGGAIFVQSSGRAELSNCTIEGCNANGGSGGAIGSQGGTVTITGCTLTNNSATDGGAVYATSGGTFTMHSGTISGNTVQSTAPKTRGGGVFVSVGATFTMKGGTISGNTATTQGSSGTKAMGGGVCVSGSGSKFIMEEHSPKITGNKVKTAGSGSNLSTIGGGVCVCDGATFEMKAGSIENNEALDGDKKYFGHTGGGVCVGDSVDGGISGATFTMKGGTINDNEAGYGGGVAVTSNSSFKMSGDDSKISGNKASYKDKDPPYKKLGSGGGVFVLYGTLDMTGGVINGNEAGFGGGIHGKAHGSSNNGEIIVSGNSTISNNIADSGGGITSEYKLFIKEYNSKTPTIKENNANYICGGIYLRYNNILSFTGGTVTGNTVSALPGLGNGMYLEAKSTKVEMSGSATVNENNDVHLGGFDSSNYAYITVTGALTEQHAATLTVRSDFGYTAGREVVKGDGFPLTLAYINKFPITKQTAPSEQEWTTELSSNALRLKKGTP